MTLAVLTGVGLGAGVWLIVAGLAPAVEPLDRALARLGRPVELRRAEDIESLDVRLGMRLRRFALVGRAVDAVSADLRVLRRDPDEQAAEIVTYGLVGLLWAPLVTAAGWLLGIRLPVMIPLWLGVAGAVGAVFVAIRHVQAEARHARTAFGHALSAYCDVVAMTVSAGYELHAAIFDAAARGDGWAFVEMRGALDQGFLAGERPWDSLIQLGHDLGVEDLVEVGATLGLAGDEGASVGETLTSKARSIRERLVTETERETAAATERMGVPGAMVLIGFLWLLAYPAIHLILQEARS